MLDFPIYNAVIEDETDGIIAISLVENPAVERNFVAFNEDKKLSFAIENEDERIITGVVMLCDTPIYRRDGDYEYYIQFSKDTIKRMSEKMLKDNTFNNINLQHNGQLLPQGMITLMEVYIKDENKGICPNFLEDVKDGSLIASFKVNDDNLWSECKEGNYLNGYSLEGIFNVRKENKFSKIKTFKMKIKEALKKLLAQFGEVETAEGIINYEGDELVVGVVVDVEDGEYHTEDEVIVVKDGKVEEIKKVEAEEETEETAVEEEEVMEEEEPAVEEEPVVEEEYDAKAEIEELKAQIEELKAQVAEILAKPVVEPIEEEFSKVVSNKYAKLGEALRQIKK